MADVMGLAGMGGAAGAGDALAQVFKQRMDAAESDRRNRELEQQDALTRLKIQEHADEIRQRVEGQKQAAADKVKAAQAADSVKAEQQARLNFPLLPRMGISAQTQQQMTGLGQMAPELFPIAPTNAAAPPASIAAPDQPQGDTPLPGTMANSPAPMARTFNRVATPAEAQAEQNTSDKTEAARLAAENRTNDNEQKAKDRLAQIAAAAAARPVADKLIKVDHKGPDGRPVSEWLPQSQVVGRTFDKPTGATTETRLASAQAVTQTGGDIIQQVSDPNVAEMLGPALGRYSKLRDFIGNPPPEFAELAGEIESYALASMGVHGMRSAQGAEQIKKLLDGHHTPESLASTIKGLNKFSVHFMENEGRSQAAASTADSGGEWTDIGNGIKIRKKQ